MVNILASVLPSPVAGCPACAQFSERRLTVPMIDIYVQHQRVAHGHDVVVSRQQTEAWARGER